MYTGNHCSRLRANYTQNSTSTLVKAKLFIHLRLFQFAVNYAIIRPRINITATANIL